MVIVTDGVTVNPQLASAAAAQAKAQGISILTIGTDDADPNFLAQLASASDLTVNVTSDNLGEAISSAARLLPEGH